MSALSSTWPAARRATTASGRAAQRGARTVASRRPSSTAAATPRRPAPRRPPAPQPPQAPRRETAPQLTVNKQPLAIAADISQTLSSGSSGSRENAEWRLAIWRHLLRASVRHLIIGVGFGRPMAFHWHGIV